MHEQVGLFKELRTQKIEAERLALNEKRAWQRALLRARHEVLALSHELATGLQDVRNTAAHRELIALRQRAGCDVPRWLEGLAAMSTGGSE